MKRSIMVLVCAAVLAASAGVALADTIATYSDFTGYKIRNGTSGSYTTAVSSDNTAETFNVTAVSGGKIAIGTSALNGKKLSDFVNFKLSNSFNVTAAGQIVYPNFWVTDGTAGHYALVAVNTVVGQTQDDLPVYNQMVSANGMDASFFDNLAVRVYATNTGDLNWLFPGCVQMSKSGSWAQSLWKTAGSTIDPVRISDIENLYFGSPFTSATVPGISPNSAWSYAGTGDPQTPDTFFLMCGDTSSSVQNKNYTLSNIRLQAVPEPGTLALLGMAGFGLLAYAWRRRS
jgi:hypothetical protein